MSVFSTAGLQYEIPGNLPAEYQAFTDMYKANYRYVSPQGTNGATRVGLPNTDWSTGFRPLDQYRDGARQAGLKFVPWSKLYGGSVVSVQAEADAVVEQIEWLKPDGWIVNPEGEYKDDPSINKVFVDRLKSKFAEKNLKLDMVEWAINPLGGASIPPGSEVSPWTFGYDVAPWLSLPNCWCIPEAYWTPTVSAEGASKDYRPLNCADQWINKLKWPAERIAFDFGWWSNAFASPEAYFQDMQLIKQRFPKVTKGYMFFRPDQANADIITRFSKGVSMGLADASATPPAPTTPTEVDPVQVNKDVTADCEPWLAQFPNDDKPLSRIRLMWRIAKSTDSQWSSMVQPRQAFADALTKVGVPKR